MINIKFVVLLTLVSTLFGCGGTESSKDFKKSHSSSHSLAPTSEEGRLTAFYGDITRNRIVGIDVKSMTLSSDTSTNGIKPYTVGRADGSKGVLGKLYGVTRKSPWLEVIDVSTREITGTIPLSFTPRSCAYNAVLGLQLVSGVNKPMASLIDPNSDEVVATVGRDVLVEPKDFGGSNATGHPAWLTKNIFALLDREARKINLYKVIKAGSRWNVSFLSALDTPTSVHHFIGKGLDGMDSGISADDQLNDIFYVVAEGAVSDNIPPSILKLKLSGNELLIDKSVSFDHALTQAAHDSHNKKTDSVIDPQLETGGHHATFHPNGKHLYVGSKAGEVLVIDIKKMHIVKRIEAGEGSGHTLFIPKRNLGVITNHLSPFITIVDTLKHEKIKNLIVSGAAINEEIMQSHTSFTDSKGDFFYAFASNNGVFYEVDLSTLEVSRRLKTGGTPVQGCYTYLNK